MRADLIFLLEVVAVCYVFYESVVISLYRLFQKENPNMCMWVVLGSKGLKLLLTAGGILLVKMLTEVPFKRFALITVAIYFASIIVETIFFLKKKEAK